MIRPDAAAWAVCEPLLYKSKSYSQISSSSNRASTAEARASMSRAISFGFRLGSRWPNQYAKGTRAEDDMIVGAEVAVVPSELIGVEA